MSKHSQVISEIVNHDLCIGCGVCSGVCPSKILQMSWCENGDLAPSLLGKCPVRCRICLDVCPFGLQACSEDRLALAQFERGSGVSHDRVVGCHLEIFVGYSLVGGHRERGASGGMATWLLENLLVNGDVDAVVCVGQGGDEGRLFEYQVLDNVEAIRVAAGSRYYPVDMTKAIALMNSREEEQRYAVVGLPCVLKGLRLAIQVMPRLRRRIIYTLGLTCSHLPNRFYTEYLARLSGVRPEALASAQYRRKENTGRADNYNFRAMMKDGRAGKDLPFAKISNIWSDGYFQFNACNYCDDIFAEVADIALMDAWLPEYESDPKGHSLLVVRNPALQELLHNGQSVESCYLEPVTVEQIVESQRMLVHNKRVLLGARLFWAKLQGRQVPEKRVEQDGAAYKKYRRLVEARFTIQQSSKVYWSSIGATSLATFRLYFLLLSLPLIWQRMSARAWRVLRRPSLLLRLFGRA